MVRELKALTTTIPIVFHMGEDPVKEGLVASFNRPGGNITGVSSFQNLLFPKRLQLLHEIVPRPAALAILVNPDNYNAEPDTRDARTAAATPMCNAQSYRGGPVAVRSSASKATAGAKLCGNRQPRL